MARLIPAFADERTPPGERDVFNLIAGGPDGWVAIHSLDLTPWNRGLRTEVDFVIIAPETGVVCVEVKSHEQITFEGDRWQPPQISRSPFKQAADARHTFYRRLRDAAPQFRHVPIVHCCIFPRSAFDIRPNLSVQPWELIEARSFHGFNDGMAFCVHLRSHMLQAIRADQSLQPLQSALSSRQVEEIVGLCLPVQTRRANAREGIERRQQDVERILREQQKPVMQLAMQNPRVVIQGAAGTGKTLMAMETARRAAERGNRVGLLCFNQLVGDWMKRQTEQIMPAAPGLIVGRAIRVMADLAGVTIPRDPPLGYWDNELPDRIQERLTDPDFDATASFDYLVIDEAQDLLARPRLWECVTGFVKGGIAAGSFCLFGDFDNQVLGARGPMEGSLTQLKAVGRPALYRLTENCRNYRIVGDSAVRLSGLPQPVYDDYRRVGGGLQNYDIFFYSSDLAQRDKLAEWLKEFKRQGYRPSEITILSFRTSERSAAALLAHEGFKLRPQWQSSTDATGYASVQAFKGMENKVIILTDVVLGEAEFHRDLFYTGMTRACESVRILCDRKSQDTLSDWIAGKAN
jgi:hypothetical protein